MAKPNVTSRALDAFRSAQSEYFGMDSEVRRATLYSLIALLIWLCIILIPSAAATVA